MKLLRTTDVALKLGLSAAYIRQLADSGKLPVQRTEGGYRIFKDDDVERLLAERRLKRRTK
jgi:excisionase family DNA binding protein